LCLSSLYWLLARYASPPLADALAKMCGSSLYNSLGGCCQAEAVAACPFVWGSDKGKNEQSLVANG